MLCPCCNGATAVANETLRDDGCVVRSRSCTGSKACAIFSTLEVPAEAISGFGGKALEKALERVRRGHAMRQLAARRRETVRQLTGKRSHREIARFLKITETRVRQLAAELRAAGELPGFSVVSNRLD